MLLFKVCDILWPQLFALANGDRVKDKQRSRSSFVVDMDKKLAAENLLK
jgi:ataxia telangiectasia mutated family protein